ncbi:MAG: ATP-binding protein [Nevskia sp.]|nr:ATP-binding protein [Nevskia sp.]
MTLLPSKLALRVALILLLVLFAGSTAFVVTLRARLQDVTAPQVAGDLSTSIAGIRAALAALTPEQKEVWLQQLNAGGEAKLQAMPGPPAEGGPSRPMLRRIDADLRRLSGDDTRVRLESRSSSRMLVEFRAGGGFYRLSLPARGLAWSALLPLVWLFLSMAGAVWAAVLIVLWQVNRPLKRSAESLARSVDQLAEIDMPRSAPLEFRIFAERFNTLAARLRAQERERGLVLAGVSHDLRAPLTRIRMRAELVDDRAAAQSLVRDAESMQHIIDQFLDYQRAGMADGMRPVDVGEIARGVVARYRQLGAGVELAEQGRLSVMASGPIVERILDNLIDNALAYGAVPVEVRVTGSAAGGTLEVRDHGSGIPPQDMARLLQPFERLDEARSAQGHCGLGLPIVDRLARQIGGRLSLSNHPSGGLSALLSFEGLSA